MIARRTWACDRMVAEVTDQRRLLPRDLPRGYVRQVTAPHRITDTTKGGQKIARYVSERADHFFFCELHDILAKETRGQPPAGASGPPPVSIREQTRRGDTVVTVVLPELIPAHWWENLLHNQTALGLKRTLLFEPGVVVTSVPFHIRSAGVPSP